jgi:hypothetical protein
MYICDSFSIEEYTMWNELPYCLRSDYVRVILFVLLFVVSVRCLTLYCILSFCIVLYCIVLYCIVLHCIVYQRIISCCIVLYCVALLVSLNSTRSHLVPFTSSHRSTSNSPALMSRPLPSPSIRASTLDSAHHDT